MIKFGFLTSVAVGILLIAYMRGCNQEIIPEPYRPRNEHDEYKHSLIKANIHKSALGKDWLKSSQISLEHSQYTAPSMASAGPPGTNGRAGTVTHVLA